MAEEQGQAQEQAKATETKTPEQVKEELKAQIQAEVESKYKADIAGLNRKVSEAEKAKRAMEQEKMTDAERLEALRKEIQDEKLATQRERLEFQKLKHLTGAGLPEEFAKRIHGETEDEIKADVLTMKGFIEAQAHRMAELELAKKLGGTTPKGGTTTDATKVLSRENFDKLTATDKAVFMQNGGRLE